MDIYVACNCISLLLLYVYYYTFVCETHCCSNYVTPITHRGFMQFPHLRAVVSSLEFRAWNILSWYSYRLVLFPILSQYSGPSCSGPGLPCSGPGLPCSGPGLPCSGPGLPCSGPGLACSGPGPSSAVRRCVCRYGLWDHPAEVGRREPPTVPPSRPFQSAAGREVVPSTINASAYRSAFSATRLPS